MLHLIQEDIFATTAALLIMAAAIGVLAMRLRQPLIVAFIGVGVLAGPSALGLVERSEAMALLAEIGVSLLLFVVGLRLDLALIRRMGPVALATGLGQVAFTSIVGFAIAKALGMDTVAALYVAVALTFSSTIIIVKLLTDKREIDSLHGRIAVGFLIVQDICVVLALIVLSAVGAGGGDERGAALAVGVVALKGVALLAGLGLLMRFVIPWLTAQLARSQELLVLACIAWAVFLAAACDAMGFSKEVGAFLAGVSLASTLYRDAIATRLVSLRDFLLLFFFLALGAQLDLHALGAKAVAAAVFSVFVLVGNPIIVMVIMGAMGYRKRTGFLAGLTVAQISEFSLVLAAMGVTLGHLDDETMGLVTLVGLITISASTYMILYSHPLYERLAPLLGVFERKIPYRELEGEETTPARPDVVLIGLGRFGGNIARALQARGRSVLGVDFDPVVVSRWRREGRDAEYGDVEDPELPTRLCMHADQWVVCTLPQVEASVAALRAFRDAGFTGRIALTAHTNHDAQRLADAGPDIVLMPFLDAAERSADRITTPDGAPAPG